MQLYVAEYNLTKKVSLALFTRRYYNAQRFFQSQENILNLLQNAELLDCYVPASRHIRHTRNHDRQPP